MSERCAFCKVPVHGIPDWKGKLLCRKCMDDVESDADDAGRGVHRFQPADLPEAAACQWCSKPTQSRDYRGKPMCMGCVWPARKAWNEEKDVGEMPEAEDGEGSE